MTELIRVTDLDYRDEDEDLIVRLVGRTSDERRVVKNVYGTEPYCFVPESAPTVGDVGVKDVVVDTRGGFESYDGRRLLQLVTRVPSDVPKVRDAYKENGDWDVFESDVPYVRRCTADYGLAGYVSAPSDKNVNISEIESLEPDDVDPIEPRICIADIEVVFPERFTDDFAEEAPNEVTAITAYDSYDEDYTLFCLDPDRKVDPEEVREHINEHWHGEATMHIHHQVVREKYSEAPVVFKRFGDETSLLESWIRYLQEKRPDIISGWNYIDFDHEYLYNRILDNSDLNEHALSDVGSVGGWMTARYIPGLPAIDLMNAFCGKLSFRNWESRALDYVADEQLGVGKVEGAEVSYEENRSKFMAYNVVDVQLCVALDKQQAIHQFWYQLSEITSIPIYSVGSTMKECEGFLFKHRIQREILPDTTEQDIEDISGGFVMPPSKGIQEWVGVLDLKSLYPSSIISCNMSKETMTDDPTEADVIVPDMPLNYEEVAGAEITTDDISWELGEGSCVGFTLDKEGILPKYLKLLFKEREEKKALRDQHEPGSSEYQRYNLQQRAIKVIMNSFFGVSDNPYFRLSADGLGGAITAASRYVNWYGVQEIEDYGYPVRYGDTDSLMLELGHGVRSREEVIQRGLDLEEELNERIEPIADDFGIPEEHQYLVGEGLHGTERHLWVYEFEKLYERYFQPGVKKRYAGHITWKEGKDVDKIDTVGIEANRSDSPEITGEVQERFLELVLTGEDFEEISDFVQGEIQKIDDMEYSIREIGVPSVINKPLEEYPNRPTKRACMYMNEHIDDYDWTPGDNPWIVYVESSSSPTGSPGTDVIALEWTDKDVPDGFVLDSNAHVEKAIQQPIMQVVKALDMEWSELKTGKKEQSIIDTGGGSVDFDNSAVEKPDFGDDTQGSSPKQSGVIDWEDDE